MNCHYHIHRDGRRYFIPGCTGSANLGKEYCTCSFDSKESQIEKLAKRIDRAEKRIADLIQPK